MVAPDDSYLYATKSYGGQLYSEMTHRLHDVAGGLVITCPTIADLDNPETGDYLRKYMRTMEGVSGEDRMRIFHIIRDLTADTYGGWDKVTNQVVGGGMHFQQMATLDTFDMAPARKRARTPRLASPRADDATTPDCGRAARRHLEPAHRSHRRRPRRAFATACVSPRTSPASWNARLRSDLRPPTAERTRLAALLDEPSTTDLAALRTQLVDRLNAPEPLPPTSRRRSTTCCSQPSATTSPSRSPDTSNGRGRRRDSGRGSRRLVRRRARS